VSEPQCVIRNVGHSILPVRVPDQYTLILLAPWLEQIITTWSFRAKFSVPVISSSTVPSLTSCFGLPQSSSRIVKHPLSRKPAFHPPRKSGLPSRPLYPLPLSGHCASFPTHLPLFLVHYSVFQTSSDGFWGHSITAPLRNSTNAGLF